MKLANHGESQTLRISFSTYSAPCSTSTARHPKPATRGKTATFDFDQDAFPLDIERSSCALTLSRTVERHVSPSGFCVIRPRLRTFGPVSVQPTLGPP